MSHHSGSVITIRMGLVVTYEFDYNVIVNIFITGKLFEIRQK